MSPHRAGARGRLVFALDATMSRQPTWDMACTLQADMFREAAALGSLDIRLVYYRGLNECRATGWISDSAQLARLMSKIDCQGGNTQIGKVLSEARREAVASAVRAVVFVGDAMEEQVDNLCAKAGELRKSAGARVTSPPAMTAPVPAHSASIPPTSARPSSAEKPSGAPSTTKTSPASAPIISILPGPTVWRPQRWSVWAVGH